MKEGHQRILHKGSTAIRRHISESKSMGRKIPLPCFPGDDTRQEMTGKDTSWTAQRVPACTYTKQGLASSEPGGAYTQAPHLLKCCTGIKHSWPLAPGAAWPLPAPRQGHLLAHPRRVPPSPTPEHKDEIGLPRPLALSFTSLIACLHSYSPSSCLSLDPFEGALFGWCSATLGQSFPEKHH